MTDTRHGQSATSERATGLSSSWGDVVRKWRRLLQPSSVSLFLLVVLTIAFSLTAPNFLTVSNALNILNGTAVVGILAFGITFVLMAAGIDLSVGAVATLAGIVVGLALTRLGSPFAVAVSLALATGIVFGVANGLLVVKARIPPIIATLGTMSIGYSVAQFATNGNMTSLRRFSEITFIGQGFIAGVPFPAILMIALLIVCHLLLTRTAFGIRLRAVGTNRRAADLMGLSVERHSIAVYALSGLLASIGGLVITARLSGFSPNAGVNNELPAIAAAVLGGTSLLGGYGSIIGTLIGALTLNVLFNGLIFLRVPHFYQLVATGAVLALGVAVNEWLRRRT